MEVGAQPKYTQGLLERHIYSLPIEGQVIPLQRRCCRYYCGKQIWRVYWDSGEHTRSATATRSRGALHNRVPEKENKILEYLGYLTAPHYLTSAVVIAKRRSLWEENRQLGSIRGCGNKWSGCVNTRLLNYATNRLQLPRHWYWLHSALDLNSSKFYLH